MANLLARFRQTKQATRRGLVEEYRELHERDASDALREGDPERFAEIVAELGLDEQTIARHSAAAVAVANSREQETELASRVDADTRAANAAEAKAVKATGALESARAKHQPACDEASAAVRGAKHALSQSTAASERLAEAETRYATALVIESCPKCKQLTTNGRVSVQCMNAVDGDSNLLCRNCQHKWTVPTG
ncbi:MAG: hypothetical protein GY842_13870 [bacterium]|nr:hypothetical protein [bacterium]